MNRRPPVVACAHCWTSFGARSFVAFMFWLHWQKKVYQCIAHSMNHFWGRRYLYDNTPTATNNTTIFPAITIRFDLHQHLWEKWLKWIYSCKAEELRHAKISTHNKSVIHFCKGQQRSRNVRFELLWWNILTTSTLPQDRDWISSVC